MLSFSFLFSVLAFASMIFAWTPLFERAPPGCIADNCLRAITGTQPGQTQSRANRAGDCSSVMVKTVTPDTVTVTTTISFTSSTTSTVKTTTTTSTTATLLTTTTSAATLTFLTTTTTTAPVVILAKGKRSAVTVSGTNFPAYASPCSGIARYTSACSCAGVTAKTITVSAPTIISTVSATSRTTIVVVSTSTSVAIFSVTSTEIDLTTASITSTSTSVAVPACTPASVILVPDGSSSLQYFQVFSGSHVSERASAGDIQSTTFPGTLSDCDAVSACGDFALNDAEDIAFDLHYLIAEQQWKCIAYNEPTEDWTVANSNIGVTYGYEFEYY